MTFLSIEYLLFLAAVVLCWRTCAPQWRKYVLFVSSYLFYFTWNRKMAVVLFAVTALCYWAALKMWRTAQPKAGFPVIGPVISFLIALLVLFKVRVFLAQGSAVIPLGLSYYTFRLVSYLLDVYWNKYPPETDFVSFTAYVAFFPQMIAGPIQRESSFVPQLKDERSKPRTLEGLLRMALGFAKKSLVADNLSFFVGWAYGHLQSHSAVPSLVAILVYPLQLYADFSGLADIAIGSGLLLGIRAPENFNRPFAAESITEFWRRWHMTLTGWLRDYVFTPLCMSTRDWGRLGLAVSLTINMILIGLWHGITAGFVAYGLFQSIFLIVEAFTGPSRQSYYRAHPTAEKVSRWCGIVYVYGVIAISTVLFRAPSFHVVGQVFGGLTMGLRNAALDLTALIQPPNHNAWVALPIFALITIADSWRARYDFSKPVIEPRFVRWSVYSGTALVWLFIALALLGTEKGADPFVYAFF